MGRLIKNGTGETIMNMKHGETWIHLKHGENLINMKIERI
jgi:hypothetical protein